MKGIPRTDLDQLAAEVATKPYGEFLPRALSDDRLRQLARDLREMEAALCAEIPGDLGQSGPSIVLLHLMTGRVSERRLVTPMAFDESLLNKLTQIFQRFVERELVTRAVRVANNSDHIEFINALDSEINTLISEYWRVFGRV